MLVLWFAPPRAFYFDQKLSRIVAQIILYYGCSGAFDFRICFGKTLIAFYLDEKIKQSVTQVTV